MKVRVFADAGRVAREAAAMVASDLTGIQRPWCPEIRSCTSLMRTSHSRQAIKEDAG